MKQGLTEIVFILDRSGSMQSLTKETIGGYNSFIEKQKLEDGEAIATCVLFDTVYETLYSGVDIKDIKPLTSKEYFARGMTALVDAIGKTIDDVGCRLDKTEEDSKPEKVVFIIITDGEENSSREYKISQVRDMIKRQTDVYNWEFIFLGANVDAVKEASNFGISMNNSHTYQATVVGTSNLYDGLSKTISSYRANGIVDNLSSNIDGDK